GDIWCDDRADGRDRPESALLEAGQLDRLDDGELHRVRAGDGPGVQRPPATGSGSGAAVERWTRGAAHPGGGRAVREDRAGRGVSGRPFRRRGPMRETESALTPGPSPVATGAGWRGSAGVRASA